MIDTGVISFVTGAVFFLVLSLVLLTGQQGRSRKNALKVASIASTVWLALSALAVYHEELGLPYPASRHGDFYAWGPGMSDPAVVLILGGSVPGPNGGYVMVRPAKRKAARTKA